MAPSTHSNSEMQMPSLRSPRQYGSHKTTVQRASISAINLAVPKKYKRTNRIGTSNYKTNQSVRNILAGLRDQYGVPTPDEKTNNEMRFLAGWQAGEPIKKLFDRLEDCYVKSSS